MYDEGRCRMHGGDGWTRDESAMYDLTGMYIIQRNMYGMAVVTKIAAIRIASR